MASVVKTHILTNSSFFTIILFLKFCDVHKLEAKVHQYFLKFFLKVTLFSLIKGYPVIMGECERVLSGHYG